MQIFGKVCYLIQFLFAISFQNVIVLDLSQDISSTTTSTTTTTATTESPIGVGNNVLSGKTNKQTKRHLLLNVTRITTPWTQKVRL